MSGLPDDVRRGIEAAAHRWWRDGAGVTGTPTQHISRLMDALAPVMAEYGDRRREAGRRDQLTGCQHDAWRADQ